MLASYDLPKGVEKKWYLKTDQQIPVSQKELKRKHFLFTFLAMIYKMEQHKRSYNYPVTNGLIFHQVNEVKPRRKTKCLVPDIGSC